jgi:hypothetical protein
MADVIDHDAKAFDRPHAKQVHVAGLCENHFVDRFKALGPQDGELFCVSASSTDNS